MSVVTRNIFLNRTELILTIIWTARAPSDIVSYNAYKNGKFVTSVSALRTLTAQVPVCSCAAAQNSRSTAVTLRSAENMIVPVDVTSYMKIGIYYQFSVE